MKTLAEYLAEYIVIEGYNGSTWRGTPNDVITLKKVIKQGIEEYESLGHCTLIFNLNPEPIQHCDDCKKQGTTICGYDVHDHSCFELK